MLADDLWLKRALPVARDLDAQPPFVG